MAGAHLDDERIGVLAADAQAGDSRAFAELYADLFDEVHLWLARALRNPEDASDAAQQVFMRAFEALPGLTNRRGFRGWVFSIARNLAFDRLGAASRSTVAMDPQSMRDHGERGGGRGPGAGADPGIRALIGRLAPAQQQVLTLRFVFDMATAEIAEALGMTGDSVRHIQQRALRSLARDPALVPAG